MATIGVNRRWHVRSRPSAAAMHGPLVGGRLGCVAGTGSSWREATRLEAVEDYRWFFLGILRIISSTRCRKERAISGRNAVRQAKASAAKGMFGNRRCVQQGGKCEARRMQSERSSRGWPQRIHSTFADGRDGT
jgi:hypothetical protein